MAPLSMLLIAALMLPGAAPKAQSGKKHGPGAALQQSSSHKWWLDERYRARLGLTQEQIQRIDSLFEDYAPVQRHLWAELRKAEREATTLMTSETTEEVKAITAIERAEFLRYKLNERRAVLLFRIRLQLTAEQRRIFERLQTDTPKKQ